MQKKVAGCRVQYTGMIRMLGGELDDFTKLFLPHVIVYHTYLVLTVLQSTKYGF